MALSAGPTMLCFAMQSGNVIETHEHAGTSKSGEDFTRI